MESKLCHHLSYLPFLVPVETWPSVSSISSILDYIRLVIWLKTLQLSGQHILPLDQGVLWINGYRILESSWQCASGPWICQPLLLKSHMLMTPSTMFALQNLQQNWVSAWDWKQQRFSSCQWLLNFFHHYAKHLKSENIVDGTGFERLIIEKPFGTSLETAEKLNQELSQTFERRPDLPYWPLLRQNGPKYFLLSALPISFLNIFGTEISLTIFKSALQNPSGWGSGGYYDHSGALKDMIQNHAHCKSSLSWPWTSQLALGRRMFALKENQVFNISNNRPTEKIKLALSYSIHRRSHRWSALCRLLGWTKYCCPLADRNLCWRSLLCRYRPFPRCSLLLPYRQTPNGKRTRVTITFKGRRYLWGTFRAKISWLFTFSRLRASPSLSTTREVGSDLLPDPCKIKLAPQCCLPW